MSSVATANGADGPSELSRVEELYKLLVAQLVASNQELVASKQEIVEQLKLRLAEKDEASKAKVQQLACYQAQFEPRIMCDLLFDALQATGIEEFQTSKKTSKWAVLLRGVLTPEGELSERAKAVLRDLGGSKERKTVIADLGSLAERLSDVHHNGAIALPGTGWRLGGQTSPFLATAVLIGVKADDCARLRLGAVLRDAKYLDRRFDESHALVFDDSSHPHRAFWQPVAAAVADADAQAEPVAQS